MRNLNIQAEAEAYREKVQHFVIANNLPRHWFEGQDHLAFKAYNPADYEDLVEQVRPISRQIAEARIGERRIAAAHLLGEYSLEMMMSFSMSPSMVGWLELMEAKPADQSNEPVRLDHEEIYFSRGIIPIRAALRRNKVLFPFSDQENESHAWVSVIMNDQQDELKFTSQRLRNILAEELESGKAKII